ncbi:MAG: UDP-N-acetylglucosamine 2-epimerase [Pseudomonadota bacterium]
MSPRRIAAVSSSRADYAHLRWVIQALQAHAELEPEVILFAAHLAPEFGATAEAIRATGVPVRAEIECLLSSDSDVGMAKTIGLATLGMSDELNRQRPDLLLLMADRYEMLAAASVGLALRIPMVHVEGGEISQGAIDDAVRNALTKMSHVHLTPHEEASRRVLAMDEEPWRVHTVGAPSLDGLRQLDLKSPSQLATDLDLPAGRLLVVAWHPLTLARNTNTETAALFTALDSWDGPLVFCFPNADAGSRAIIRRSQDYCDEHAAARLFVNLESQDYFSLLACAQVLLGNSSSGIMEAASFKLPCVDVGRRQQGRLKAANVLSVPADPPAIVEALKTAASEPFRDSLAGLENPYGDGRAGDRIAKILASTPDAATLLHKVPTDPPASP